jgi:NAD dependent epimerase/dehydratase family enzyme
MYTYAIENEALSGVYNAVAPSPVSNKTMMLEIAQLITGRFYLSMHVPAFVLKLLYGELGAAILKSTTVSCGKISRAGFQFLFPAIEPALYDIEKN